jgi:hypothetical protein
MLLTNILRDWGCIQERRPAPNCIPHKMQLAIKAVNGRIRVRCSESAIAFSLGGYAG